MFMRNRSTEQYDQEANRKALVAKYSRGNVSLQNQRYITEKEKEKRKKRILGFKFA